MRSSRGVVAGAVPRDVADLDVGVGGDLAHDIPAVPGGRVELGRAVESFEALGLLQVEDVVDGAEGCPGRSVCGGRFIFGVLVVDRPRPEYGDRGSSLALPHGAAGGLDLSEPCPSRVGVPVHRGGDHQEHRVVPLVLACRRQIARQRELAGTPRLLPGRGAGLDGGQQSVCEGLRVVLESCGHGSFALRVEAASAQLDLAALSRRALRLLIGRQTVPAVPRPTAGQLSCGCLPKGRRRGCCHRPANRARDREQRHGRYGLGRRIATSTGRAVRRSRRLRRCWASGPGEIAAQASWGFDRMFE